MTSYIKVGDDTVEGSKVTKPDNRTFRDAWSLSNNKKVISVDMAKAKTLHKDVIRAEREAEFAKNDIALMDAIAAGNDSDKTTAINRQKALRDAPAHSKIANAADADALAKITLNDVT